MEHTPPTSNRASFSPDFTDADTSDGNFLLAEVKHSDLTKYTDAALAGRFADYDRRYTFERDVDIRAEYKQEAERTAGEISRRRAYARRAADRVFA